MEREPSAKELQRYESVRERWEEVCSRCGRCCFERELGDDGEVLVDYASPCRFFDMGTHLCRVYKDRFRKNERCARVTLRVALFDELLPEECAYRQLLREESDGTAAL